MCIDAWDYLFLVSGATFQELEEFHAKNGMFRKVGALRTLKKGCSGKDLFFFDHVNASFGEVLYLKLYFLKEVVRHLCHREDLLLRTDFVSTFDRTSIHIGDSPWILPVLWNLNIKEIGSECESGIPSGTVPLKRRLFCLMLVWFYSLLVNKKQSAAEVDQALRDVYEKEYYRGDIALADFPGNLSSISLLPENIFWNPSGNIVPLAWIPLWEKTLLSGWSLLKENIDSRDDQAQEVLFRRLDSIAGEVKLALFRDRHADIGETRGSDREAIHGILVRIGRNWEIGTEQGESRPGEEKGDLLETVILQPGGGRRLDHPSLPRKEHDLTTDTVLLSSKKVSEEKSIPPSRKPPKDPGLLETVILGDERKLRESGKEEDGEKNAPNGFLAETVILRAPSEKGKDGGRK